MPRDWRMKRDLQQEEVLGDDLLRCHVRDAG